ncbi:hypothetical protein Tco_0480278 [Tanacetum coccineum]
MEKASLHTTRKHLFISTQYYDKHGVPPTKRLFKVAMLDPSPEFIGHWGMSGDPGLPIVHRDVHRLDQSWQALRMVHGPSCKKHTRRFQSFCVNYIKVELLKEQNPSEQSCLRIFLSKEIFEGGMIRINSAFVHNEPEVFLMTVPRMTPKAKSLDRT